MEWRESAGHVLGNPILEGRVSVCWFRSLGCRPDLEFFSLCSFEDECKITTPDHGRCCWLVNSYHDGDSSADAAMSSHFPSGQLYAMYASICPILQNLRKTTAPSRLSVISIPNGHCLVCTIERAHSVIGGVAWAGYRVAASDATRCDGGAALLTFDTSITSITTIDDNRDPDTGQRTSIFDLELSLIPYEIIAHHNVNTRSRID